MKVPRSPDNLAPENQTALADRQGSSWRMMRSSAIGVMLRSRQSARRV
jgi:hypothetical protein